MRTQRGGLAGGGGGGGGSEGGGGGRGGRGGGLTGSGSVSSWRGGLCGLGGGGSASRLALQMQSTTVSGSRQAVGRPASQAMRRPEQHWQLSFHSFRLFPFSFLRLGPSIGMHSGCGGVRYALLQPGPRSKCWLCCSEQGPEESLFQTFFTLLVGSIVVTLLSYVCMSRESNTLQNKIRKFVLINYIKLKIDRHSEKKNTLLIHTGKKNFQHQ